MQIAALLLLAAAAAGPRFRIETLAVDGDVFAVVSADLDGDGRKDLLAAYTTGIPPYQKRSFAVFWNRNGVFAPRADLVLPLPDEDICAFDVGNVGNGSDEVLLITPRGVLAGSFRGRVAAPPRKLVDQPTLFHQPIPGELPRVRLVHDVAAAGSHDLLVPALGWLGIWKAGPSGYEKTAEIEVDLEVSGAKRTGVRAASLVPALEVRYGFPAVQVADTDGDGLRDLIATQEDRVATYRQLPGVTFARQPDFTRDFGVRTPDDHRERSNSASVLVSDLDGDGVADLVIRKQVFQGVTSAVSSSYLFFGKRGGGYEQRPAQVIRSEGVGLLQMQLLDLTGDGRPDLVVPETSFGVFALVRMLTARTAKVVFQIYPFDRRLRRFTDEPAADRDLKFHLSLAGDSDLQAVYLGADFTGDGRPDLVFGSGEEELSIFPHDPKSVFSDDAIEVVPVRSAGVLEAVDLDGKGRSDIVLHYPHTRGHRGEIVVLVNIGPW